MRTRLGLMALIVTMSFSAIAQIPSDYLALVQQGKTQLQSGNNDAALASANAAIKLDASRWEAYVLAAGALVNLGQCDEAKADANEAIKRAPDAKQAALRGLTAQCVATASDSLSAPPSSKEPSYDETMTWLRAKIESQGGYGFTNIETHRDDGGSSVASDGTTTDSVKYKIVSTDSCELSWDYISTGDDSPKFTTTHLVLSSLVEGAFFVKTFNIQQELEGNGTHVNGAAGLPGTTYWNTAQPDSADYVEIPFHTPTGEMIKWAPGSLFVFSDRQLAQRVANALNHAIELCGGQKRVAEPF